MTKKYSISNATRHTPQHYDLTCIPRIATLGTHVAFQIELEQSCQHSDSLMKELRHIGYYTYITSSSNFCQYPDCAVGGGDIQVLCKNNSADPIRF